MECPSCHTPVDSSQRFCPKCGGLVGAEAAAVDPLIGTTIGGKYKIVKMLGEGGMGAVYEGEQTLGTKVRRVAIKTLHAHLSKDPKIIARFQREVGTIAELEHPNTIQVYDFGSTPEGQLYIVMEYVQGLNLADQLEKHGPLEPKRAENILAQICGSLEEAHARGIVHRDLKPENVVLTERAGKKDFVKVLDFGIAKRGGEEDKNEPKLTQAGMVLGTPPYMSPEQFTGKPIDSRSDIYSLGVMAYEMVAGKLPFKADTAWEWATQHMTVQPIAIESTEAGSHVPQRMKDAIKKALAKSPDDRWSTVGEFLAAFSNDSPDAKGAAVGQVGQPSAADANRGGTAVLGAGAASPVNAGSGGGGTPRAKTEVGAPLDGSFGAPAATSGPGGPMSPAPYSPPPHQGGYGAPPAGAPYAAQAAPYGGGAPGYAQPGIPQGPSRDHGEGGGGGKGILLVLAALLGVGAIVIVVFAVKGSSGPKEVDLGPINGSSTSTAAATTTTPATTDTTPPPLDTTLPPLASGKTAPTTPTAVHTNTVPITPPTHPTTTTPTTPPTTPTAPPTTPPTTPPPPPAPAKEPAACAAARQMRTLNMMKEFNNLAAQCRAQGGNP